MNYDKPKLRDFRHGTPYVSIWYSIVFHVVLFITALNLAKMDFALMADDFKKNVGGMISNMFDESLSPNSSMLNELFMANKKINFDKRTIKQEINGS